MIIKTDHGPIREIRLNRPPVNALSAEFMVAIRQALEEAHKSGVRAVILSGQPGIFSAGLDLPFLLGLDRPGIERLWRELYALMRDLTASQVPIAAAITGHAPAGGTVIALLCDYRVAAQGEFKLGVNEVQVGIPLPPVIIRALRRQVGPRQAERLAVAGPVISPDEAWKAGLVDELAAPDQVLERALAWCRTLVAIPPQAMLATRRHARADLVALFENPEEELGNAIETWWSEETQGTLRTIVEKLRKKP
ncbi:MAG TPA: enoyl-CoA hydratase/isomerase family protein [Terriglobales bacterium]|nr:enoyl-CoA hydratase/isomerase family protein [Terriglobales bacterium]